MSTRRPQSQSRAKSAWLPSLNLTGLWRRRVDLLPRRSRLVNRQIAAAAQVLEKRTLLTYTVTQNQITPGQNISISDPQEIIINSGVILNTASSTGAAGNITLSAPKIVIQSGAILETSSSIGQAGSISLSASRPSSDTLSINADSPSIEINAGAQLLATGTTSANNGAITIDANGTVPDAKWALWAQAEDIYEWVRGANATITINQTAAISGGNVTISTAAGDQFKTQNMVDSYTGVGGKAEEILSKMTTLPVSIIVKQPEAEITFVNSTTGGSTTGSSTTGSSTTHASTISSSGNVKISSLTTPYADAEAFWGYFKGYFNKSSAKKNPFGAAVGVNYINPKATVELQSQTAINAAGTVTIGTTATVNNELTAKAKKAQGASEANAETSTLAIGVTILQVASTINVDAGASITAGQTVQITAAAVDKSQLTVKSASYEDGRTGVAVGFAESHAHVQAIVDGSITASGNATVPASLNFNADLVVNFATDSLIFPNPIPSGYQNGTEILYDAGPGGVAIPGLHSGGIYYAILNPSNPRSLQLAATLAGAISVTPTPISFGGGYPTLTDSNGNSVPITSLNPSNNTIPFDFGTWQNGNPLFTNGETVTYTPVAGQFIGSIAANGIVNPLAAGSYTVLVVNSSITNTTPYAIQLINSSGQALQLTGNSSFTAGTTTYTVGGFDINNDTVNFNFPSSTPTRVYPNQTTIIGNLINGQALVFNQGLGVQISNLTDGQTYYAIVDPTTPGVIQLANTQSQSQAANPVVQDANPTLMGLGNQPLYSNQLLIGSATTATTGGALILTSLQNLSNAASQNLSNNATGGTFVLNLNINGQAKKTSLISYNASSASVAAAIDSAAGLTVTVTGAGTTQSPWIITPPVGTTQLMIASVTDSLVGGSSSLCNPMTQTLSNTATSGTFVLNLTVNGQSKTTTPIAYNASNISLAAAIQSAAGLTVTVNGSGTAQAPWVITTQVDTLQLLIESVTDSLSGGISTLSNPLTQALWSTATAGTFSLTLTANGQTLSTPSLNYNAAPADIAASILAASGVSVTVTGSGTAQSPWLITPNYQITIANIESGVGLVFQTAPGLMDGTPIVFQGASGRPVNGLVSGQVYYASNQVNPSFNPIFSNYILGLTTAQSPGSPLVDIELQQSLTDTQGNSYVIDGTDGTASLLSVTIPASNSLNITSANGSSLTGGTVTVGTLSTSTVQLSTQATGGSFTILVAPQSQNQQVEITAPLPWNATASQVAAAMNLLPGVSVTVTGSGSNASPWVISGTGLENGLVADDSLLTGGLGTISTNTTALSVLQLWNNAVGGTFTLSVNPNNIGIETSVPLAWNATATDIAAALNLLAGVTVSVIGSGTAASPWQIAGDGIGGLSTDDSQLTASSSSGTAGSQTNNSSVTAEQLWTDAASGTFTISVTSAAGLIETTAPIPWDATPDAVEIALNALNGVNIWSVTGSGVQSDPWTIAWNGGTALSNVSTNNSQLLASGAITQTNPANLQPVWTTASGGTFTLSLVVNGQTETTAPLNWNASAADVAAAFNSLPGLITWVSGSGTATDPWLIQADDFTISTGTPLIFTDSWGLDNPGLINGNTYYAVVNANQESPGSIILGLTNTLAEAQQSSPPLLPLYTTMALGIATTNQMAGVSQSLAPSMQASGIQIRANLTSTDSIVVYDLFGTTMVRSRINKWLKSDVVSPALAAAAAGIKSAVLSVAKLLGFKSKESAAKTPKPVKQATTYQNQNFRTVLAADSTLLVNNTVEAIIGSTAILLTPGSVLVESMITENLHSEAEAETNVNNDSSYSVDVAVAVALVHNTSRAYIASGAQVTGGAGVSVNSKIDYPWQGAVSFPDFFRKPLQDLKTFASDFETIGDNELGIDQYLFNNWTDAFSGPNKLLTNEQSKLNAQLKLSVCFSVSNTEFTNENLAQIAAGAQINQTSFTSAPVSQPVSVTATTNMAQTGASGNLMIYIDPIYNRNSPVSLPGGTNSVGGSSSSIVMNNHTNAYLGNTDPHHDPVTEPTRVNVGSGGLTVNATTNVWYLQLVQGGGSATNTGVAGSLGLFETPVQETTAAIVPVTPSGSSPLTTSLFVTAAPGTMGDVKVNATDETTLILASGNVLKSQNTGVGVSVSVVDLHRNVSAYLGRPDGSSPLSSLLSGLGNVTIQALASGSITPLALAGTSVSAGGSTSGQPQHGGTKNQATQNYGIGVSGDAATTVVDDTVLAYINDTGTLPGTVGATPFTLTVTSEDRTQVNSLTGAYAQNSGKSTQAAETSVGIAGSLALNFVTANVEAFIDQMTITSMAIDLSATNEMEVGALAAGGNANTVGNGAFAVAGSIAENQLTLTTQAELNSVTGTNLANLQIVATNAVTVWGVAGTLDMLLSEAGGKDGIRAGFGLAGALNQLDYQTNAEVNNSSLTQTSGGITITATDKSANYGFATGANIVQSGVAGSGMFTTTNATLSVNALIQNSTINSTSASSTAGLMLASTMTPLLISAAGSLVVTTSSASANNPNQNPNLLGAGVAVTEVTLSGNSTAQISSSNVTLTSGPIQVVSLSGAPANLSSLTANLSGMNLPYLNSNNIYSFAVGATVSNSLLTGDFAVSKNTVTQWNIEAEVINSSIISSSGNIAVNATDHSSIYSGAGALSTDTASSKFLAGLAAGAAVSSNSFTGQTVALIDSSTISCTDSQYGVAVTAASNKLIGAAAVGAEVNGTLTLGTSVVSNSITDTVNAAISGKNRSSLITCPGGLSVQSTEQSTIGAGAGQVAFSTSAYLAAGAAAAVNTITENVSSSIADATVVANSGSVSVNSVAEGNIFAYAIGVAGVFSTATSGDLFSLSGIGSGAGNSINNAVSAFVGNSNDPGNSKTTITSNGLTVSASDSSSIQAVAGAVSVQAQAGDMNAISMAVGVSDAINNIGSSANPGVVSAEIINSTINLPQGNLNLSATDTANILAITAAGSGTFNSAGEQIGTVSGAGAGSGNTIYQNVSSIISGSLVKVTGSGNVTVNGESQATINAYAGGVAIAGSTSLNPAGVAVSVGAAAAVNTVSLTTESAVTNASTINFPTIASTSSSSNPNPGNLSVSATDNAAIEAIAFGVAGSFSSTGILSIGGAGSAAVNTINSSPSAFINAGSTVSNATGVSLTAAESSSIIAGTGALAAGIGVASAVSVSVAVSFSLNTVGGTVQAEIDNATVSSSGLITISAGLTPYSGGDQYQNGHNIYAVAVAGSGSYAGGGEGAISIAGAGAGTGNTVNFTVEAEVLGTSSVTSSGLTISATDNSSIYSNAGGIGLAVATSGTGGAGIAVGAASGTNNITNTVTALVLNSTITTTHAFSLQATSTADITSISWGVAITASLGQGGFSASGSGAGAYNTIANTIQAGITGGTITAGTLPTDSLSLSATDQSQITCNSGAGSLSTSGGEGSVSLAPGVVVAQNTVGNTTEAFVGNLTSTSSAPTTSVIVAGPLTITAAATPEVRSTAVAVAVSAAFSAASFAFAGSGANVTTTLNGKVQAGILTGASVTSNLSGSSSVIGVLVSASAAPTVSSTVGSSAIAVGLIGASIGVSLAQITDNDSVTAVIEGNVTTRGTPIQVTTTGQASLTDLAVATAASVSANVAAAGGNAQITNNAKYQSVVAQTALINTGTNSSGIYGNLSVIATSTDSLNAQVDGGVAAVGSIGAFLASASSGGTTSASVSPSSTIIVGNLLITATTNQTVATSGDSVTVGLLTGVGVTLNSAARETVSAVLGVATATSPANVYAYGNTTVQSISNNTVTANNGVSSSDPNISISEVGAGIYQTTVTASPTVTATVQNVNLTLPGAFTVNATSTNTASAQTASGSGAIVGGTAAVSTTINSPTLTVTVSGGTIQANTITISGQNTSNYICVADSTNASVVGGSGADAENSGTAAINVLIGNSTTLLGNQSVTITGANSFANTTNGLMVKTGAGGVINGNATQIDTNLTGMVNVNVNDGANITANLAGGILIDAIENSNQTEQAALSTGGAIEGADNVANTTVTLNPSVTIGTNVTLNAPNGSIGIGTVVVAAVTNQTVTHLYGLAGGGGAHSNATVNNTQSVVIGSGSSITAGNNIYIEAGTDSLASLQTSIIVNALANSNCSGVITIPAGSASAIINTNSSVTVASGSNIFANQNVYLTSNLNNQDNLSAYGHYQLTYQFLGIGSLSTTDDGGNSTSNPISTMSLNGNIVAGYSNTLNIVIPSSGNSFTVNGQSVNAVTDSGFAAPAPFVTQNSSANSPFTAFTAAYDPAYNPQNIVTQLNTQTQAVVSPTTSNSPVPTLALGNLQATGGQVLVNATSVSGSGSLSANVPTITITNQGTDYIILNGITIPTCINIGNVTFQGGASPQGTTLSVHSNASGISTPSVYVSLNSTAIVGTPGDNSSGPALMVTAPINNTAGNVSITNNNGSLVQLAAINAISVSVTTPNGAYAAQQSGYWGAGGNIANAWQNTASSNTIYTAPTNVDSNNTVSVPNVTSLFYPGQTSTGFNANLAATTAADYFHNPNGIAQSASAFTANLVGPTPWGGSNNGNGYSWIFFGDAMPYVNGTGNDDTGPVAQNYAQQGSNNAFTKTTATYYTYTIGSGGNGLGQTPLVMPNLPLKAVSTTNTVASSFNANSITAAQISITASIIDLNSNIVAGTAANLTLTLSSALGTTLNQFQTQYNNGQQSNPIYSIPSSDLIPGVTATYSAITGQITVSQISLGTDSVQVNLTGQMMSSVANSSILVQGGAGISSIQNNTNLPVIFQGITTGSAQLSGSVNINDTYANKQTLYVYQQGQPIQVYSGAIGANLMSTSVTPTTVTGTTTTFAPTTGLAYTWTNSAEITRPTIPSYPAKNENNAYSGQWSFVSTANNPYSNSTNGVTATLQTLSPTSNVFTENVTATINTYQSEGIAYHNAWGFAGDPWTQWYQYPTDITLTLTNSVKADYPVNISFTGMSSGSVSISSSAGVTFAGPVTLSSPLTMNVGGTVLQTAGAITAASVNLTSQSGELGTATQPLIVNTNYNGSVSASAPEGVYLTSTGNLNVNSIATPQGSPNQTTISGFGTAGSGWTAKGTNPPTVSGNTLTLTSTGSSNSANAFWYNTQVPTSDPFIVSYSYTASLGAGNGAAFVIQGAGINALGTNGSGLGCAGISPSLAYEMNLSSVSGFAVVANGATNTTFASTSPVNFTSGDKINVTLTYNTFQQTLTQTLTDTVTGLTLTSVNSGVNLATIGSNAYLGFTASTGSTASTSPQTISNFLYQQIPGVSFAGSGQNWQTVTTPSPIQITGFGGSGAGWTASVNTQSGNKQFNPIVSNNVLTLTESGSNPAASGLWYNTAIPTDQPFSVNYTYQGTANGADGVAFVIQNSTSGTSAIGGDASYVGYGGISNSLAFGMESYNNQGCKVGQNGTFGSYTNTSPVNLSLGHSINVALAYNPSTQILTQTLTDTVTNQTFTQQTTGINLATLANGSTAYLGFTGGTGGLSATQTISNFSATIGSPIIQNNQLQLTQSGSGNSARAAWYQTPVPVAQAFQVNFTYTGQANGADGVAFVMQNDPKGTNALGSVGGGLGYVGIKNSLALELNIYNQSGTNLQSNGATGAYLTTGAVNLRSGNPIAVSLAYNPTQQTMTQQLTDTITNATFSKVYSNVNLPQIVGGSTAFIGFTGADGVVSSNQVISQFSLLELGGTSQIQLTAGGSILPSSTSSSITGNSITLTAGEGTGQGSIGSSQSPISLNVSTVTLQSGVTSAGIVNASAPGNIWLTAPTGNLPVGLIDSQFGTVTLNVSNGSILTASDQTSLNIPQNTLSYAQLHELQSAVQTFEQNSVQSTISAFEASINQYYAQYWSLMNNGTVSSGAYTVDPSSIPNFQPITASALGLPAGTLATNAQVQSQTSTLYQQCVAQFSSQSVFGPDWQSLTQFKAYQPSYTFVPTNTQIAQLSYGAYSATQGVATLELQPLTSANPTSPLPPASPNIVGLNVVLNATGSIGLVAQPTVITVQDIQSGNLTRTQQSNLAMATASGGALQMVGVNASGQQVKYTYGNTPAGVTPIGFETNLDVPVYVNVAQYGTLTAIAPTAIAVTQTTGNLIVAEAASSGPVNITAPGSLYTNNTTSASAISTTGFGGSGTGWTATGNGKFTPTVSSDVLTLTQWGTGGTANALWYNTPVPVFQAFQVSYTYTVPTAVSGRSGADGVAFVLQNNPAGTLALGGTGGGVGYSGINQSLAFILNIYGQSGWAIGQNGVVGSYTSTSPIQLASGDAINVTLSYNPATETLVETLTDPWMGTSYSHTTTGVNLASLLGGSQATIGFTGGDGEVTSTQQISNFSLQIDPVIQMVSGFSNTGTGWTTASNGAFTPTISNNVLTLTKSGIGNTASAVWLNTPVAVSAPFTASFTYTMSATSGTPADGVAFVLQNSPNGTSALGSAGYNDGYTGITNSGAFVLDLYPQSQWAVGKNGAIGSWTSTPATVSLTSGHPINVTLAYNPANQTLTETLTDTVTGQQYNNVSTGINFAQLVGGSTAYLGFTGGDGGYSSTQQISNFSFSTGGLVGGSMNLVAGGSLGGAQSPLNIQASGVIDLYSNSNIWLQQSAGNLNLGQVTASGSVNLIASGAITESSQSGQGSISGFGGTGSGWFTNGNAVLTNSTTYGADTLTLVNGANQTSSAWYPNSVVVANSFTTGFVYTPGGPGTGMTFTLQNDSRGTSALGGPGASLGYGGTSSPIQKIQQSLAFQINLGADSSIQTGIGLGDNGQIENLHSQAGVATNPANPTDPIQVLLTFSVTNNTVTYVLIDTVTQAQLASATVANCNLASYLGNATQGCATAYIGFTGSSSSQSTGSLSVSNFFFAYGAPAISAASLTLQAGTTVGTPSSPLAINIASTGTVNLNATNNINLIQIEGNLNLGTVSTPGTLTVSAPLGAVTGATTNSNSSTAAATPAPATSRMMGSDSFAMPGPVAGPVAPAPALTTAPIQVGVLKLYARDGIGSLGQPLNIQAKELQASSIDGDITVSNRGPLAITSSRDLQGLSAGGSIRVTSTGQITVSSPVKAGSDVTLTVPDQGQSAQNLIVTGTGIVESKTGSIRLTAADNVQLLAGSLLHTLDASDNAQVSVQVNRFRPGATSTSIQALGQIISNHTDLMGSGLPNQVTLSTASLTGVSQIPMVQVWSSSAADQFTLDQHLATAGQVYQVSDKSIKTDKAIVGLNGIKTVSMNLGSGNDTVNISSTAGLNSLTVRGNQGNDQFNVAFDPQSLTQFVLDGGAGTNGLKADAPSQPLWATAGRLQTQTSRIDYSQIQTTNTNSATSVNGNPLSTEIPSALLKGLNPTQQYVQTVYWQLLGRIATTKELSQWVSQLTRFPNTRTCFAQSLVDSTEYRSIQIRTWYQTYLGRPATTPEVNQSLAVWKKTNSDIQVLAPILATQEFYNITQSLITTGTPQQRYVTGLYKLVINPSTTIPTPLKNLMLQTPVKQGRNAIVLRMLTSPDYVNTQRESLSVTLNHLSAVNDSVMKTAPVTFDFSFLKAWLMGKKKV